MKIGLLSDTHGYLDDAILKHFENCDEIWHIGDFGSMEVIEKLEACKPLRGVFGNIDDKDIRLKFTEHLRFHCEQVDVWMNHIGGYSWNYRPLNKTAVYYNPLKLYTT